MQGEQEGGKLAFIQQALSARHGPGVTRISLHWILTAILGNMWGGQTTSDRYDSFTVSSSITNLSKVLGSTSHGHFFFSLFYLVVPGLGCSMRDFHCSTQNLQLQHVGSSSPTRPPVLGTWSISHQTTREFPYAALPMCQHYSKHLMYVTHLMTTVNNSAR